jgi:putative cell wall-binding protein
MHQGISRFRKMAIAAVATVATTAGLLPLAAVNAGAAANFDLTRFAGADRYDTAAKISAGTFTTATDVVVTTGENFPDALAGNYLAGNAAAPILLTQKSSVPATTQAEITRLKPQRVWVLGGTDAVGAGGVPTTSGTVTRIGGATRYETAVQANSTGTVGTVGGLATAIIATGDKFADALSAGPGAFAGHFPLYLTPGAPATALHSATKSALTARGIKHVILMGGTNAVSAAVESEIQAMGITTERAAGADRTETARNFAETILLAKLGFSTSHMNVARGDLFPDALSGGPHAGKEKAPILLTWTSTAATADGGSTTGVLKYAADHKATLTGGHIFGGTDAVSAAVEAAIEAAGGAGGTASNVTTRPELVSASIVETVTAAQATIAKPAGTYVRYNFDEALTGIPNASLFHVYNTTGGPEAGSGTSAAIEAGGTSVLVRFGGIATSTAAGQLSVATVDENAVVDANAQSNPEGNAAIGTAGTQTLTAGITAAPDLQSLGGFRSTSTTGTTAIDFVFDEAATVLSTGTITTGTSNWAVVLTDNTILGCAASNDPTIPSGTNVPGGSGTTTITVLCQNPDVTLANPGGTPLSTANVARGVVLANTVQDASGNKNPLETADAGNGGNTVGPDLVSVTLNQGSGTTPDSAVFDFDTNVTTATLGAFTVYTSAGTVATTASAVTINTLDPSLVLVTYNTINSLDLAVGGSVADGGVTTALGTNRPDEVGASNATTVGLTPGRTDAPDLTGVAITPTTGFGTVKVTYSFDEDVASKTDNLFYVYTSAGVKYAASTCAIGTTAGTTNTVTCTVYTGASDAVVATAVLGTVNNGAVADATGTTNPGGAAATTGGTGTPAA